MRVINKTIEREVTKDEQLRKLSDPTIARNETAIGPFSGQEMMDNAIRDSRTHISKLFRATVAALTDDIYNPSAMERMLIEFVASKYVRLYLINRRFFEKGDWDGSQDEKIIAWFNSARADLVALGLKRRVKEVEVSLGDIVAQIGAAASSTDEEGDGD